MQPPENTDVLRMFMTCVAPESRNRGGQRAPAGRLSVLLVPEVGWPDAESFHVSCWVTRRLRGVGTGQGCPAAEWCLLADNK